MFTKILVPYDFSKYATKALNYAIEIAKKFDATLYLLTVVDPHEYLHGVLLAQLEDDYSVGDTIKKFIKAEVMACKKKLTKKAKTIAKKGIKVHHHAMKGPPIDGILDYCTANKINMIIMGSKGLTGISKIMALGSVSRKISEIAKCPVMIVR